MEKWFDEEKLMDIYWVEPYIKALESVWLPLCEVDKYEDSLNISYIDNTVWKNILKEDKRKILLYWILL